MPFASSQSAKSAQALPGLPRRDFAMPIFRIVYIDDDTFAPRTLTAAFPDRAAVEIAMAKHGHRVAHVAELRAGESAADPIAVPMVAADDRDMRRPPAARAPERPPLLGLPRYDLAGVAVVAVGFAIASAAFFLF
jgi:hypothetical protein